jgi:hypothetical protein
MPKLETRIERGTPTVRKRADVGAGLLFRLIKSGNVQGDKTYASIGRNGRFYSINIATGALAATDNGDKNVAIVGSYKWDVTVITDPAKRVNKTRGDVDDGEVFVIGRNAAEPAGTIAYLAIGKNNAGKFLAVNLTSGDYAVTPKANKPVIVIGKGKMQGQTV